MPHTSNKTVRRLRHRLKHGFGLHLETLEQRWLLSASTTVDGDALVDTRFSGELVQQLDPYRQPSDINGQLFELIVDPVPQWHDADDLPLPADFNDGDNDEGVIALTHDGVHAAKVGFKGDAPSDRDLGHLSPVVAGDAGTARSRSVQSASCPWSTVSALGGGDPRPDAGGERFAQ